MGVRQPLLLKMSKARQAFERSNHACARQGNERMRWLRAYGPRFSLVSIQSNIAALLDWKEPQRAAQTRPRENPPAALQGAEPCRTPAMHCPASDITQSLARLASCL